MEKQVYAAIYTVLPTLLVLWDRLCVRAGSTLRQLPPLFKL